MMARTKQLSSAMARALRMMAAGDTRIDFIWHRHAWVTIRGVVVADTTLRALERRGYVAAVGVKGTKPNRHRARRLTRDAKSWLDEEHSETG